MVRYSERIEFEGSLGSRLAARLDRPESPRAWAVFAHCFTCSKEIPATSRVARGLAERGIGVLRFDFTGLGHSEGEFANTDFSSNVGDLVRASDYLRREHRVPAILVGHSLGGAAVLAAAEEVPEAVAVATIGAPAEPEHVRRLFRDRTDEIESKGSAEVEIGGRSFRIRREFLDDIAREKLDHRIAHMGKALLVMHSPIDNVVGIENAAQIFRTARHPKSFLSLDGADHMLSRPADADYASEVLAAWVQRYLPSHSEGE